MPTTRPRPLALRPCAGPVAVIGAALCALAVLLLQGAGRAAADTPWGSSGASYRSGIVCALPDGRRVALASWAVDGTTAFATADVVARGAAFGAAPRSGVASVLAAGFRGLAAPDLATLAYLVTHAGAGTPVQVAETSALVARSFGGGAAQQACLGRGGTSAAGAAALLATARRAAGPYTVQVDALQAKPGWAAPVTATVLSAAGAPAPGVAVTFALGGATATASTGADGRASARLTAPASATVLTATAAAPVGLRLIRSNPSSITAAAPRSVVGRATFVPALHPAPELALGGGAAGGTLVLAGGSLSPTATVTGTYGYAGTGTVQLAGPVVPPAGAGCSGADYDSAPVAWSGSFSFSGDGPQPAGRTAALAPGCYGVRGSLTTVDADPAVTVQAAVDPASAVAVSSLAVTQSVGSGLAGTGALTATVTATGGDATVTSAVVAYGPLAAHDGRCDSVASWAGAPVVARTPAVSLAPQAGGRLSAAVHTPAVTRPGCYALAARSTVSQDGRSAVVAATPGTPGTTVHVIAPRVGVTNSAYDGRQGVPMTGTLHVTGTSGLPGRVAVGLVSATAPPTGCHGLALPATAPPGGSTTVDTDGDGDYRFRTPVPGSNRCYGVVAMLAMTADPTVRVAAPAPGPDALFLAGAAERAPRPIEVAGSAVRPDDRQLVVLGVAGGAVLVVALLLMIAGVVAGERKPDVRAADRLVEIIERPRVPLDV